MGPHARRTAAVHTRLATAPLVTAIGFGLLALACGGAAPPPSSSREAAAPTAPARVEVAAPTERQVDPPCAEAQMQSHPRRLEICAADCENVDVSFTTGTGRGDTCLATATLLAKQPAVDDAAVRRALERACDQGNDEGCYRASLAAQGPEDAARLSKKGCREDGTSEFARKNCLATAEARFRSGELSEVRAALQQFTRLCDQGERRACSGKANAARAIEKATAPVPVEGKLVSRTGTTVRIKLAEDTVLTPGMSAELQRAFEGKAGDKSPLGAFSALLGGRISGWISIASVAVTKVQAGNLELTIKTERSNITMNRKKVNHFTPGAKVRLLVPRSSEATASRY